MNEKKLPQEGLKLIACVTMLMDHMGVALFHATWLRLIGRIAFPIYCFLLAEGAHYTRNPRNYGLRMAAVMLLSEIPFDFAVYGRATWLHQNVLMTLLLGFLALELMGRISNPFGKLCAAIPFVLLADLLHTDYGSQGVLMILFFGLCREYGLGALPMTLGLAVISLLRPSFPVRVLGMSVPIELFSVLSMIPIALYSGKKAGSSKVVQWGFYLFYPVHLAVLWLLRMIG